MSNYRAVLLYDGSRYSGWQRQPGLASLQAECEKAVSQVVQKPVKVIAASRTDAGVHAEAQVVNFKVNTALSTFKLQQALNFHLPKDMAVRSVTKTRDDFHARFDARGKHYRYTIHLGKVRPVFDAARVLWVRQSLDVDLMRRAAKRFVGRHDFGAFSNPESDVKHSIRTLKKLTLKQAGAQRLVLDFWADSFLRNMIRIIVGTLIEVGRGRLDPGAIPGIFKSKDRRRAGPTAGGSGLSLIRVYY